MKKISRIFDITLGVLVMALVFVFFGFSSVQIPCLGYLACWLIGSGLVYQGVA